jgi:hypothetical protein
MPNYSSRPARPELKIDGDTIAFVYPRSGEEPADNERRQVWGMMTAVMACLFLGTVLLTFAWTASKTDTGGRVAVFIVGCGFMVLVPTGIGWMWHRYRHRDRIIQKMLDQVTTELSVVKRRLIRRYASGREVGWPREKIEDVLVEKRTESVGGESNETIQVCDLRLSLREGGKVHLYGRAAAGTFQEQDLHWMAGELRRALQVPYAAPPTPIEGASVERNADELVVRVPYKEPEAVWRESMWTWFQLIGGVSVFLAFSGSIATICALTGNDADPNGWLAVGFVFGSIPIVAVPCGAMALMQYVNKTQELKEIADRTLVALGVRSTTLFRRYASGREECWPGTDIAAVRVDGAKKNDHVQVRLKEGMIVHLFGQVPADERHKLEREGLQWLALELSRGLGLTGAGTACEDLDISEAITNFDAAPLQDGRYRVGKN